MPISAIQRIGSAREALLGVRGLQESGAVALSSFEESEWGGGERAERGKGRGRVAASTRVCEEATSSRRAGGPEGTSPPLRALSSLPEAVEELRTVGLAFYRRRRCVSEVWSFGLFLVFWLRFVESSLVAPICRFAVVAVVGDRFVMLHRFCVAEFVQCHGG